MRPDVVVVDQVSAVIPLLQWFLGVPVLFYCHFPDCLLANPRSTLHRLYRWPIHHLEESTTGMADEIVVNSRFTQGMVGVVLLLSAKGWRRAWCWLCLRGIERCLDAPRPYHLCAPPLLLNQSKPTLSCTRPRARHLCPDVYAPGQAQRRPAGALPGCGRTFGGRAAPGR